MLQSKNKLDKDFPILRTHWYIYQTAHCLPEISRKIIGYEINLCFNVNKSRLLHCMPSTHSTHTMSSVELPNHYLRLFRHSSFIWSWPPRVWSYVHPGFNWIRRFHLPLRDLAQTFGLKVSQFIISCSIVWSRCVLDNFIRRRGK